MNIYITLCIAAVHLAAPLHCRSVDVPRSGLASIEADHSPHDGNLAELLIPFLERSLNNKPEGSHKYRDKKVIQILPYEGSEEQSKYGWKKLKTNKKQLVEITPLRRKEGDSKPLAYILSAANPFSNVNEDIEQSTSPSAEVSIENSETNQEHNDSSDDVKHIKSDDDELARMAFSENKSSDITSAIEDVINYEKVAKELVSTIPVENENLSQKISDEILRTEKNEEDKEYQSIVENETDNGSVEGTIEHIPNLNSIELQFGPGNNIIFERDSSESVLKDTEEVTEDVDNNSANARDGADQNSQITIAPILSEEAIYEEIHISDENLPNIETIVNEYSAESNDSAVGVDVLHHNEHSIDDSSSLKGNNYEFRNENLDQRMGSENIIEIIKPLEETQETEHNCDRITRNDKAKRDQHSREHKSYRLSFLFNR